MPSIPLPTEQSVFSQGALPYRRIDASPEDFGALEGRAVQGMGQTLAQAGEQTSQTTLLMQQYANERQSMSALNTFQTQASDLMNGNADKGVTGFNTLLGKDAVQQQGNYQQQLQQAFDNARGQLNPAAQRMFDQMGRWALRGAVDRMGAHAAQQQIVYDHTEARSSVALNQQAAVNGADDPNVWANALAATQEASLRSSRIMGLDNEAAEAQRKADLSKIYVDRTQQLALRDPIAASKFYNANVGMIDPAQRYSLERVLNETTQTQYAASDASGAVASALGQAHPGALPPNYNAPTVKPYDQNRIEQIAAEVKKPSGFDPIFNKVAAQYNLNPTELKMRAVAESGMNPNAVSSQGAIGLAQLMPDTAKALGVDPRDPAQAIDGMARLMVKAGATAHAVGGQVDRAYYGGSTNAQGPNTDQYVANLAAVRGRLYGGGAPAPLTTDQIASSEGAVISAARAAAEQRRPGDGAYANRVVSEAQRQWSEQLQSSRGVDYGNMTQVLDATIKSGAQSVSALPPALQQTYALLTPRDQLSVNEVFRSNLRRASGEYTPSDPKVFNDTLSRINLPTGDPNKITDPTQITPLIAHGLNYTDANRLITQMKDLNSPEANPFLKQTNQVKQTAQRMLSANLQVAANPELGQEAAYRFGYALDQNIAAYRKAGKDPQSLFDPTNPDYVLKPERVMSFLPPKGVGIAKPAANGIQPQGVAPRMPGESPEAYLTRTGVN
jgi:soluble lytic murein transglycosylase